MKGIYDDPGEGREWSEPAVPGSGEGWFSGWSRSGWFDDLRGLWQWDELAAEVSQEGQARVVLAGLVGAGKSLLFNRLRGWVISETAANVETGEIHVEFYGAFVLADLPANAEILLAIGNDLPLALGDPTLIIYVVDATCGVQPVDYRWLAMLRASGKPVVVALNKCDCLENVGAAIAEAQQRLGMSVIPISAETGLNVEERLLPAMLDAAPRLAVALGREILCLRRQASRRVIRQAALFAGMMGAQPIPILDLPFQAMLQAGVVMRVGAAYGRAPSGGVNRELVGTVAGSLALRYLAQTLVKLIPVLGWVASGGLAAAATYTIGEAAILYYEAGGTVPLKQWIGQRRGQAGEQVGESASLRVGESASGRVRRRVAKLQTRKLANSQTRRFIRRWKRDEEN